MKKNRATDLRGNTEMTASVHHLSLTHLPCAQLRELSQKLLPLERISICSFAFAICVALFFQVNFYFPNGGSAAFALNHYIIGFILASVTVLFFSLLNSRTKDNFSNINELFAILRNTIAFTSVVFLHFNFKLWAQLVNPLLFDDWYQASDQFIKPAHDAILYLNQAFSPLKLWLPNAYHDVFVFMFFTSFAVYGIFAAARSQLGKLTSAIALVLAVGGISYMVAPAKGPFIFSPSASFTQLVMSKFQVEFVKSGGAAYAGHHFISPLAAMPSLHCAHAFVLWFYARRHVRWLSYIYLPLLIFIITEAVASEWHYIIDLFFGLVVAYVSMYIAERMHRPIHSDEKQSAQFPL